MLSFPKYNLTSSYRKMCNINRVTSKYEGPQTCVCVCVCACMWHPKQIPERMTVIQTSLCTHGTHPTSVMLWHPARPAILVWSVWENKSLYTLSAFLDSWNTAGFRATVISDYICFSVQTFHFVYLVQPTCTLEQSALVRCRSGLRCVYDNMKEKEKYIYTMYTYTYIHKYMLSL